MTDKESFDHVRNWMLDIDKFAKEGVLRFLIGNKCDLQEKRQISADQGNELAKQYGIPFLETSAKDTLNIDELFLSITKNFLEKQTSISSVIKKVKKDKNLKNNNPITVDKLNETGKRTSGCC